MLYILNKFNFSFLDSSIKNIHFEEIDINKFKLILFQEQQYCSLLDDFDLIDFLKDLTGITFIYNSINFTHFISINNKILLIEINFNNYSSILNKLNYYKLFKDKKIKFYYLYFN